MRRAFAIAATAALGTTIGVTTGVLMGDASPTPTSPQQSRLVARSVLGASAVTRPGSPPSGAFLSVQNRSDALKNGVVGSQTFGEPYFPNGQPVQGFSGLVPVGDGSWWALADNGFGTRDTSADWQLAIYRIDPGFAQGHPTVLETVLLSDPANKVTWQTVCDPTGTPLPPLTINALPAPTAACTTPSAPNLLTGFDFDPESIEVGADGSFWIGDEFGPFLLHADRQGRLLEAPIGYPNVKSPQNPTLAIPAEKPNVAASRGFEGLAISPDRKQLYAMFEGPIEGDHQQDVRIATFDIKKGRFTGEVRKLRMEMPGTRVNLTGLRLTDGSTPYPDPAPPAGTQSAAELTAIDKNRFLVVERDGAGDGEPAPRFKKVLVIDTSKVRDGYVEKQPLVDLMAVPDPQKVGNDGDFFRFPFNTIESVHVVDDRTIIVANDNNYPTSNGRARSTTPTRTTLGADDDELILVELGSSLKPDHRLLAPG